MRIHYLQHVPFEDPGYIGVWAKEKGHSMTGTKLYANEALPKMDEFDWLVIMGGPMNIYEEHTYPWLAKEKVFIAEAIRHEKIILGVCLGAQLIADVIGGKVIRNPVKEIGWFPIQLTPEGENSPLFSSFPLQPVVFHWHGDTFTSLPEGTTWVARSEGCFSQVFVYKENIVGLQFHLEMTLDGIKRILENCGDEMTEGTFIQQAEVILSQSTNIEENHMLLYLLLDELEGHWLNQ
ncbi:MAG TPA: amidotransferase [Paenibacillaceae bacterium]|nr:amidotransferase [Paenibacillaceae bacterium]